LSQLAVVASDIWIKRFVESQLWGADDVEVTCSCSSFASATSTIG
jgi:hypothetical protein